MGIGNLDQRIRPCLLRSSRFSTRTSREAELM
jgi:hypothetical protein